MMHDVIPMPRIHLDIVHERNVGSVRLLTQSVLPVRYNEKFYAALLNTPEELTKIAFYNDVLAGTVGCRLEPKDGGKHDLYIMTLCVFAVYRRRGVGSRLIQEVLDALPKFPTVDRIYLHVQTNNEAALAFYKRYGFEIEETVKGYYKRLDPPDCYILSRLVTHDDAAGSGSGGAAGAGAAAAVTTGV